MKINIYADGANIEEMLAALNSTAVRGFTTNPTLMRKAGITNYLSFAEEVLEKITTLPVSFEVFSDDFEEMYIQAKKLAALGKNVFVKIPVTNTRGDFSGDLIERLDKENVKMNITAVFTVQQIRNILEKVSSDTPHILSVFAGRIADTGVDPVPIMKEARRTIRSYNKNLQLLWASPREVLNVYQADEMGCDIITLSPALLKKLPLKGKDLEEFSRETVLMFYDDARSSGFGL